MKIFLRIAIVILIGSIFAGTYYWLALPKISQPVSSPQIPQELLDSLNQQTNSLLGWVQGVNSDEGLILIRRKKLQPFGLKRETVKVTKNTVIKMADQPIDITLLQKGHLIRVLYKGRHSEKGTYVAEAIEVQVKNKKSAP